MHATRRFLKVRACTTVSTACSRARLSASAQEEVPKVCGRYWYALSRLLVSTFGSGLRPATLQKRDAPVACACTAPGFVPAPCHRQCVNYVASSDWFEGVAPAADGGDRNCGTVLGKKAQIFPSACTSFVRLSPCSLHLYLSLRQHIL